MPLVTFTTDCICIVRQFLTVSAVICIMYQRTEHEMMRVYSVILSVVLTGIRGENGILVQ